MQIVTKQCHALTCLKQNETKANQNKQYWFVLVRNSGQRQTICVLEPLCTISHNKILQVVYSLFQNALESCKVEQFVPKEDVTEQTGAQIGWKIHRTCT